VGINTPLRLYELLAINDGTMNREAVEKWEKAIDLYEQRQFMEAAKLFASLTEQNPNDKTAEFYKDRCMKYENNPPPEQWDAVNNLTEK